MRQLNNVLLGSRCYLSLLFFLLLVSYSSTAVSQVRPVGSTTSFRYFDYPCDYTLNNVSLEAVKTLVESALTDLNSDNFVVVCLKGGHNYASAGSHQAIQIPNLNPQNKTFVLKGIDGPAPGGLTVPVLDAVNTNSQRILQFSGGNVIIQDIELKSSAQSSTPYLVYGLFNASSNVVFNNVTVKRVLGSSFVGPVIFFNGTTHLVTIDFNGVSLIEDGLTNPSTLNTNHGIDIVNIASADFNNVSIDQESLSGSGIRQNLTSLLNINNVVISSAGSTDPALSISKTAVINEIDDLYITTPKATGLLISESLLLNMSNVDIFAGPVGFKFNASTAQIISDVNISLTWPSTGGSIQSLTGFNFTELPSTLLPPSIQSFTNLNIILNAGMTSPFATATAIKTEVTDITSNIGTLSGAAAIKYNIGNCLLQAGSNPAQIPMGQFVCTIAP